MRSLSWDCASCNGSLSIVGRPAALSSAGEGLAIDMQLFCRSHSAVWFDGIARGLRMGLDQSVTVPLREVVKLPRPCRGGHEAAVALEGDAVTESLGMRSAK